MKRTSSHLHATASYSNRSIAPPGEAVKQTTKGSVISRSTSGQAAGAILKKFLLSLIFATLTCWAAAQDTAAADIAREATGLRAYGKVYVVVAVLATILAGFFIYVIRIDRKISRLEKE